MWVGLEKPISHLTELHFFGDDFYKDLAPNGARTPFGDWNRPRGDADRTTAQAEPPYGAFTGNARDR
jgi:hypothetical protein